MLQSARPAVEAASQRTLWTVCSDATRAVTFLARKCIESGRLTVSDFAENCFLLSIYF
jgi:hypothetical protein